MPQTSPYKYIFSRIHEEIKNKKGTVIVGVSGAYTSGKTIFTEYLSNYLRERDIKTQVLNYDDFHRPLHSLSWPADNQDAEVDVFYNQAFDADKLPKDILEPLSKNRHLKKTVKGLNWMTGRYEDDIQVDIDENTVVLLEGMLLFRSPLISCFDYKIFLDTSENKILDRGKIRDVPKAGIEILEKYKSRYIPVLRRYLSQDRPLALSDMVINNNDFENPRILPPNG